MQESEGWFEKVTITLLIWFRTTRKDVCSGIYFHALLLFGFILYLYMTTPQIFTRARGPLAASAHEVDTAQVRVLIGCVFVEIVIESETCHICRAVLLTI
jgi:hypothetical protein